MIFRPAFFCSRNAAVTDGRSSTMLSVIMIAMPERMRSMMIHLSVFSSLVASALYLGSGIFFERYAVRMEEGKESANMIGRNARVPFPAYMEASAICVMELIAAPAMEIPYIEI